MTFENLNMEEIAEARGKVVADSIRTISIGEVKALGVKVHLIDGRDSLLGFLDHKVSQTIENAMKEEAARAWASKYEARHRDKN